VCPLRLKKIEIIGFKSFADKVVLEFSPGVTAIVGPNGCGKSNISDAFRWVLGEQSAKSMRGSKMPDVIFAGTSRRQPVNIAEVTITLTDITGELPIDYGEVAITRRLHRSGESQYFINKHPVRLKDIESLLLDSGMGKNAFSIFEQGKIDQVIQYTPLERRYIFEEAAGILRFLQRKREALRKLEQADLNVTRIQDIHQEVEKQILVLEEQAAKARLFKAHKANLELLEKTLFILKWDLLQQQHADIAKKETDKKQQCVQATQQLEATQASLQESKQRLSHEELTLRAKSEELFMARSKKEIKIRERLSHQERLKETVQKSTRWQQEISAIAEKRQQRQTERSGLQQKQTELNEIVAKHESTLNLQREQTRGLELAVSKLRDQQQTSQRERIKQMQSENQIESEIKQNQVRQENQHDRCNTLQKRDEKLTALLQEMSVTQENKKREMQSAAQIVDQQKTRFQSIEERIRTLSDELKDSKNTLDNAQQELTEAKARQKALLRLREDMEGFSAGSKRLLKESADQKSPLFNLLKGLYEMITPQSGAEAALAAAMRPYTQTLVVQSEEHFQMVLSFAKKHQVKDFSLLCLATLPIQNISPSKSLSDVTPLLEQVTDNVLARHFLKNVSITETFSEELQGVNQKQGGALWVQEGMFLDSNAVLFYMTQGENNVFLREAELRATETKLATIETHRLKLDQKVKDLTLQRNESYADRTAVDKNLRRDEMKLVEVNFGLQRIQGELEKAHSEKKQLDTELQALTVAIENVKMKLSELSDKHILAKSQGTQIQQQCLTIETSLEQQLATMKTAVKQLQDTEGTYRNTSEESKKVAHALQILEVKDRESQQQETRLTEEIQLNEELKTQLSGKGVDAERELEGMEKTLSDSSAACVTLDQEVMARKKATEALDEQIQKERIRLKSLEEDCYKVGVQLAQNETSGQALTTELETRYQMSFDEAREAILTEGPIEKKSIDQTEKQIRMFRQEIEKAGDINMTSIEECDKHKVRYEFLNNQMQDMDASKQELIQIITQLDTESRKIFKETFAIISANFKKNFSILFNGGEADLQFTETSDILEAGIEIIAKPPGKQMRSINLLSGGEKCLTALALLFAIFEVKPAPFCILDEIDAPLDDSNVERFANVVKQFIERCQFIIITHNKRTMSIADILFGISMEEKGVSKLLTMEFAKQNQSQIQKQNGHDTRQVAEAEEEAKRAEKIDDLAIA
jgi:chromosome segregation protein